MKLLSWAAILVVLAACQQKTKSATGREGGTTDTTMTTVTDSTALETLYQAGYSSNFNTTGVSNADLNTVMKTYKDWENGNVDAVTQGFADSVMWDNADGQSLMMTNAQLNQRWKSFRDSLSSVKIDMEAYTKLYAADKNEGSVITWYKETDTYKTGKVDSAMYTDINLLKNGRIAYFRQYKRLHK
jgi:ketosteroid isomerase-like protein